MKTSSSMRGRSSVLASPSWDSNGEDGEMTDTQIQEGHRPLFLPYNETAPPVFAGHMRGVQVRYRPACRTSVAPSGRSAEKSIRYFPLLKALCRASSVEGFTTFAERSRRVGRTKSAIKPARIRSDACRLGDRFRERFKIRIWCLRRRRILRSLGRNNNSPATGLQFALSL